MIQPAEFLTFVELEGFADDWSDLGLTDDDLASLQAEIMASPARAPVVQQTGGLRKLRFAPPSWSIGKSGAVRVCYVFLEQVRKVLLIVAYGKRERADLTAAEKKAVRQLIERLKRHYAGA